MRALLYLQAFNGQTDICWSSQSWLFEQRAVHTYNVRLTWLLNAYIKSRRKIKHYKSSFQENDKTSKTKYFFVFSFFFFFFVTYQLTHVGFACNVTTSNLLHLIFFSLTAALLFNYMAPNKLLLTTETSHSYKYDQSLLSTNRIYGCFINF